MKRKTYLTAATALYIILCLAMFSGIPIPALNDGMNNGFNENTDNAQNADARDGEIGTPDVVGDVGNPKEPLAIDKPDTSKPEDRTPDTNAAPDLPNTNARDAEIQKKPDDTAPKQGLQPAPPSPDTGTRGGGQTLSDYASEVVRLVNRERAAQGLSALTADPAVASAAQVRAREQEQSFSHTRPNGQSAFTALSEANAGYRGAGENIAMGQTTPAQVMTDWMNSPGHRSNILNSRFTKIGVGCYKGKNGTYYWAQLFTH